MTTQLKMLELYENVLNSLSHEVTDDGFVTTKEENGVSLPIEVDGKRLVIPMPNLLSEGDARNIFFHPLKENIANGPSKVLEWFRSVVNEEMSGEFGASVYSLLATAADTNTHKTLTPQQSEVMDAVKSAKAGALKTFHSFILKSKKNNIPFVHVYLKRGGKDPKTGEVYRWLATVTFPMYERFVKDPASITGTAPSKPDQKAIKDAIEFLYPGIGTDQQYSYGSNSVQASKFDALLGAIKNLRAQIFAVAEILKDTHFFTEFDQPTMVWSDYVGNLEHFKKEVLFVPMQAGNEGSVDVVENEGAVATKAPAVKQRPEITEDAGSGNSVREERGSVESESSVFRRNGRLQEDSRRSNSVFDLDRSDDRRRDSDRDDRRGRDYDRRSDRDYDRNDRDDDRRRDDRRGGRDERGGGNPNSLVNVVASFGGNDRDDRYDDRDSRYREYRDTRDRGRDDRRGGYGRGGYRR